MAGVPPAMTVLRAAKDELRKVLKKALRGLTEQQKLEQSAKLVTLVRNSNTTFI